jgi:hypothetical protein
MKNVPAGKTTRSLWITLEATEIIELKRIKQDYDEEGALTFFRQVVAPRVRAAALQCGLALDLLTEEAADERISR